MAGKFKAITHLRFCSKPVVKTIEATGPEQARQEFVGLETGRFPVVRKTLRGPDKQLLSVQIPNTFGATSAHSP
jgi:hypothetical protein